ncbi:MAG: ABC transporter permease, partial [Clostridium sp.]
MKNVIVKDTFREIKKSFGRFLSIFAIVTLGVAFFAGINVAAPDMKITADTYYDDQNFMDIKLVSTLGFDNYDVEAIKEAENVDGIYATNSMDVLTNINENELVLKVHGIPSVKDRNVDKNYINRPTVIEGRLPGKSGECVIEQGYLGEIGVEIGTKILVSSGTADNINNRLKTNEYTVVGTVNSPNYLSFEKGNSNIGNGKVNSYVMILDDDIISKDYTEVYVTVNNAKELNSFTKKYEDFVMPTKKSLEFISKDRVEKRYNNIVSSANITLDEAKKEYIENKMKPEWYILDRNSNYSFVDYGGSADNISAIAKVFPIFFFLVAALICSTTMTRMVDEQRVNIGTLKALGYSKIAIASKYILYAAMASIGGSVLGIIIGFTLFPIVIFNAYSIMYTLPPVILTFNVFYALLSTLSAVLITTMAAHLACNKELVEMPSLLMRPKAPKEGKRILLERIPLIWNRFNFSKKVTARNI